VEEPGAVSHQLASVATGQDRLGKTVTSEMTCTLMTKDNRPLGQGVSGRKTQQVVGGTVLRHNKKGELRGIHPKLTETTAIDRTTPEENPLTTGIAGCHNARTGRTLEIRSASEECDSKRKFGRVAGRRGGVPSERIARSDECAASVAVSGRQSGYSVPLHHGRRNTCIQTGKPLETAEDDPGSLDGTQDEPGAGAAAVKRDAVKGLISREAAICGYWAVKRAGSW
jgi:hypothetical protein